MSRIQKYIQKCHSNQWWQKTLKTTPSPWDMWTLINPSLDWPHSPLQTASRPNQQFFHNSPTGQTDRQTDTWDWWQLCTNSHLCLIVSDAANKKVLQYHTNTEKILAILQTGICSINNPSFNYSVFTQKLENAHGLWFKLYYQRWKDFSRSRALRYTGKVVLSQKRC